MQSVKNPGTPTKANEALLLAAREGNIMEAEKLLKKGFLKSLFGTIPNVNAMDKDGKTPLKVAIENRHIEMVKFLLEQGADIVDHRYRNTELEGWTALFTASSAGFIEIVRLLLEAGAKVNAMTYDGHTPLYYASQNGDTDIVKLLISKGAEVTTIACQPLGVASLCGHIDIVKLLLENGADVNKRAYLGPDSGPGPTALEYAMSKGHRKIEELLLAYGANKESN